MTQHRLDFRPYALLGLVMLLWAGNSIVGRAVREDIPPFTLAFLRWSGALLVLSPFAMGTVWRDRAAILAGWKPVLLLGVLGIGIFNAVLYLSLHYTPATNALLLQAAIPALVMLLDRIFFGARSGAVQIAGVVLSIVGVTVIVFQGDPSAALRLHLGRGDALVLLAVVVWSLYTVLLRLRPAISPVSFIWTTFAVGVFVMAPAALWEWQQGLEVVWGPPAFGALLYVCLLPSLASYFIYNWATAQVGPARAGQAITMMPIFGALLSAALLDEALHSYHLAGMGLILAGIVIAALALRQEVPAGKSRLARRRPPG